MKEHMKRAVQKLLIKKRHRLYEERVAGQTVPYDIWLEKTLEQEREEELSKQVVLQVQKYEGEKVKESNVEEIIQKALRKKRDDRGAR